ncbi:hypothetical protein CN947_19500 [Bacillus cereus]|nr:hypothetical protein CN947_19500 [Bacillus cereus]
MGKGNISEEIVEVSLPFVFKLIGIIPTLSLYSGLYQYALKKDNDGVIPSLSFLFCFLHKSFRQMLIRTPSR